MSDREFLETLYELRVNVAEVVRPMHKAADSADERTKVEAAELTSTPALTSLPEGADAPPESPYQETMVRLATVRDPVNQAQWRDILAQHATYLTSGALAWPGEWQSLVQSNVTFAVYDGPETSDGVPADLWLRTLPMDLDVRDADLRLAHLCGLQAPLADLSGANLERAMGTDANLSGACLDGANLTRADFSRTNFRGASLRGADLSFADLENCDLTGADLAGATLRGTKLDGACLTEATFGDNA